MNSEVNQPLVSVLMPSYNSEDYIAIAIESVLNSTYLNFELIITDDKSTDGTFSIAKSYEAIDGRVKVYLNDKNYGDYPNRNRAASFAKGKYLKYVDHDDYIYPYGLEQLVYFMEQFPEAGYGLCSLDQHDTKIYPFQLSPKEAYHMHYFGMKIFNKAPLSSIIHKKAFDAVGGFTGKPLLGDFEMWHLLSQNYPVVIMPKGIVWYRKHDAQESAKLKGDPAKSFKYLLLQKEFLMSPKNPLDKNDVQHAQLYTNYRISRAIFSACKHHSIKKGLELKDMSNMSIFKLFKGLLK
jgi:glycosyltransferase involved in cell wall biosynthesis